jgi:hypothetical protein
MIAPLLRHCFILGALLMTQPGRCLLSVITHCILYSYIISDNLALSPQTQSSRRLSICVLTAHTTLSPLILITLLQLLVAILALLVRLHK